MGRRRFALSFAVTVVVAFASARAAGPAEPWPQFRGPSASGIAAGAPAPTRWNVTAKQNLLWKTPLPGLGHSSPVTWGDRIFVTSAISGKPDPQLRVGLYGDITPVDDDTKHRFVVYCLDRRSGKVLWERVAYEGVPAIKRHPKASHANSTAATDGRYVVAFFGSEGLYAYDIDGNLKWKKSFGVLDAGYYQVPGAQWGFGSSPVIWGDRVIVQVDVQQDSFLAALAVDDGRELWRVARAEVPTWSTPTVHTADGRTQVIVNGWKHLGAYDLATGQELWRMRGRGDIPVPTPVVAGGLIFVTHAHGGSGLFAIRVGATGAIDLAEGTESNAHVAWSARAGAYMQTPLALNERLYVCRDNGVLTVHDAKTGARSHQERLGTGSTGFTASAVASGGHVYYTSEAGDVHVLQDAPQPKLVATNELGEVCMATPAISDGVLYFRTRDHLLAIGERPPAPGPAAAP